MPARFNLSNNSILLARRARSFNYPIGLAIIVILALISCFVLYEAGISSTLYLDTPHNLMPILNQENSPLDAEEFIWGNNSGPLGRSVSMLTFWLQSGDQFEIENLRIVNILIHLTIGLIFAVFSAQIFKSVGIAHNRAILLGIFCLLVWTFHPGHVSTVQYVVQRMAQLATLFSVLSLVLYIAARNLDLNSKAKKITLLTLSGISAILGLFSKENAILILPSIVLIEFALNGRELFVGKSWKYKIWFWIMAVGLCVVLLGIALALFGDRYQYRSFTLDERVLTQFRVLSNQLSSILFPNISASTVFHDGYPKSFNFFQPISTLFSAIFIILVFGWAVRARLKYPIFSFAILWFFVWHIVESTILPLELHFEHRNYMPMMGPIIGLVYGLSVVGREAKKFIVRCVSSFMRIVIPAAFAFLTMQLNLLWAEPLTLTRHWVEINPNSSRAKILLAEMYAKGDVPEEGLKLLQSVLKMYPDDLAIMLEIWRYSCINGLESPVSFSDIETNNSLRLERGLLSINTLFVRDAILISACDVKNEDFYSLANHIFSQLDLHEYHASNARLHFSSILFHQGRILEATKLSMQAFEIMPQEALFQNQIVIARLLADKNMARAFLDNARSSIARKNISDTPYSELFLEAEQFIEM